MDMDTQKETTADDSPPLSRWGRRMRESYLVQFFSHKSFFHYLWTGGLFTALNIFLVWLFIEIFEIPTLVSSVVVIGGLFIARYVVYRWLKVI